ncbi:hypothetical protein M436DRAFT_56301 [Aureobasidium namibiae CBS 147.97]|uniref:VIT-domain-containing protein n=1 Tax=Aureobasidium namibiae CBS 147.97 TaxID=1043004 RepID=A0A074X404_9PEZI|nr:uncharacterized protein M436DRAFT_56301 [Aureobasidium namibiae CBS 147.97]KEQ69351.1 hypothetical protein M436DRAFT_56301 [Aureobasidium namibiae CBS 147.97]
MSVGNHVCGCYHISSFNRRTYLPQVHLDSHTTITPLYSSTKLSQTFQNPTEIQLPQTRYTFPLYDGVIVTAFSCTIGDKVIKGHVEQKEQARKTFNDAVSRGETAGLLESLPTGVFGVTLGNVPAHTSIQVDIVYGGELKHDAQIDGLRYILPTSIARRYGSYPGEFLQPDSAIARGMKITVDIDMEGSSIRKVQCLSGHSIALDMNTLSTTIGATPDMSKASVSLTHGTTELLTDLVLQILIDDIGSPKAILEKHSISGCQALMATFVPRFNLKPIRPEIIFIADQSGSMQGAKNTALIAALKTFLKSLPPGVRFNICAFGSHHQLLWEKSVSYNQENFDRALCFVQGFTASYGGTELLSAVQASFESHFPDMPLELVVLTDGEIYAESQLFQYVNSQIHEKKVDARCFVLGVGRDVSHTLVEGFARAGNGVSQFITDDEIMDFKVIRMLKAALYPHVKDYRLEVKYDDAEDFEMVESVLPQQMADAADPLIEPPKAPISLFDPSANLSGTPDESSDRYAHLPDITVPGLVQAPHVIPPLLPYSRTTVCLLLQNIDKAPKSIVLHGTCPDGPLMLKIPVKKIDNPSYTVNTLAAKRVIQELEEGRGWLNTAQQGTELVKDKYPSRLDELVEKEVVRLGVDYQVANKWCSFVAVEPDQEGKRVVENETQEVSGPRSGRAKKKLMAYPMPNRSLLDDDEHDAADVRLTGGGSLTGGTRGGGHTGRGRLTGGGGRGSGLMRLSRRGGPPDHDGDHDVNLSGVMYRRAMHPSASTLKVSAIPTDDILPAVRALVDLQSFDGHWDCNEALNSFFASEIVNMKNTGAQENAVLATALVLAWLKISAAQYSDLWEMVADKGTAWLATQENSELLMYTARSTIQDLT